MHEHFDELIPDALFGNDLQTGGGGADRIAQSEREFEPKTVPESDRAKHSERIIVKGLSGLKRSAQHSRVEVVLPGSEWIDNFARVDRLEEGINREISSLGILEQGSRLDIGLARASGIRLLAGLDELDLHPAHRDHGGPEALVDDGKVVADFFFPEEINDFAGWLCRDQVEVFGRLAEENLISYGASDEEEVTLKLGSKRELANEFEGRMHRYCTSGLSSWTSGWSQFTSRTE